MTALEMSLSSIVEDAVVRALTRMGVTAVPAAPAPAPGAPVPAPAAVAPTEGAVSLGPVSYEQLKEKVAPMMANPDIKKEVTKIVKKYCDGQLKNIKPEDYPALIDALNKVAK